MFEGKTAVITGGASGIGLSIAEALGNRGATLVLADLDAAALDTVVSDLSARGMNVHGYELDVTNRTAVNSLATVVENSHGGCDLLFNNAGVAVFGPLVDTTEADWDFTMGVNFWGVVNGLHAFVPAMISRGSGHIVNTASMSGLIGMENLSVYCASKFAVVGISESIRRELAPGGIGVSVLCPMVVDTPISENSVRMRPGDLRNEFDPPEVTANLTGGVIGADEVAEMVLAAIADNQPYILTHADQAPILHRRAARLAEAADRVLA